MQAGRIETKQHMKAPALLSLSSIASITLTFAVMTPAFAQTNFTGSWMRSSNVAISGKLYPNGTPYQLNIRQAADSIHIDRVTASSDGDITSDETFQPNGAPLAFRTRAGLKKVITATWNDDRSALTEQSVTYTLYDSTMVFHFVTDIWTVRDGQFILRRKDEDRTTGEIWESQVIYKRR